jgi:malonyl-CoA O-methyltransferase
MAMAWPRRWRLGRLGGEPLLSARDAYALWADTYPPEAHNPLMVAEQSVVEPILRAASPVRALDVGTGTGRNLQLLTEAGARLVVGVDLSLAMLSHRAVDGRRVCGDASRLPFADAAFDVVCASLMAGDLEDVRDWIAEAARLLAPNGHLVYSDFHPVWSAEQWRRTFRAADGRRFAIGFHPHSIEQHLTHLAQSSFAVRAIREPRAAGQTRPAVVVFHAVRTGRSGRSRTVA